MQKSQIDDEKSRHADAHHSKSWAARAGLPDALSALCKYSEGCAGYLMDADGFDQMPDAPIDAISVVKSCVEYVDSDSAEKLFELIVHYQIYNSRLSSYRITDNPAEKNERMYDTACLRALVNRLFEYARNKVRVVPDTEVGRDDIASALRACVGVDEYYDHEAKYESVMDIIDREHSGNNRSKP
ncbi:MAG: hypothetical protein IID48_21540 [Proteobacteria bacterium]|nr:hypothetical protein [Pseudomonadota bacterium]